MQFLSDVYLKCPDCQGRRFRNETLDVLVRGKSIADALEMTVSEALAFFADDREVHRRLQPLVDVGLDYLRLGQPVPTLSGGEAQRLKIAGHLADAQEKASKAKQGMLLLFDEPTTGLHFDDIAKLIRSLRALVKAGHSLLVIEHNLDLIAASDWLIDLGPEAGPLGGGLVAQGRPEDVAVISHSHTGVALARHQGAGAWATQPMGVQDSAALQQGITAEPSIAATSTTGAAGAIHIQHAREHNLKDVSVQIPRDQLTVISGVSGSGKSTLAFDILFSEGQRRYLESLNAYARQFVQPSSRPDVDAISGIPPTVAIEQRTSRGGRKSTVGTLTEIHHFLRLLYVKIGVQQCPNCTTPIAPQTPEAIVASILHDYQGQVVGMLSPLVIQRKGVYQDLARWAASRGHSHLRVDGEFLETNRFPRLDRYREHTIELPIGDLLVESGSEARLRELVEQALELGQGTLTVLAPLRNAGPSLRIEAPPKARLLSTKRSCPTCNTSLPEPEPRLFSYNTRLGWCPSCTGTGLFATELKEDETGEEDRFLESPSTDDEDEQAPLECPECEGARLNPISRSIRINHQGIN
jgi:excinuclease ABC subunit A